MAASPCTKEVNQKKSYEDFVSMPETKQIDVLTNFLSSYPNQQEDDISYYLCVSLKYCIQKINLTHLKRLGIMVIQQHASVDICLLATSTFIRYTYPSQDLRTRILSLRALNSIVGHLEGVYLEYTINRLKHELSCPDLLRTLAHNAIHSCLSLKMRRKNQEVYYEYMRYMFDSKDGEVVGAAMEMFYYIFPFNFEVIRAYIDTILHSLHLFNTYVQMITLLSLSRFFKYLSVQSLHSSPPPREYKRVMEGWSEREVEKYKAKCMERGREMLTSQSDGVVLAAVELIFRNVYVMPRIITIPLLRVASSSPFIAYPNIAAISYSHPEIFEGYAHYFAIKMSDKKEIIRHKLTILCNLCSPSLYPFIFSELSRLMIMEEEEGGDEERRRMVEEGLLSINSIKYADQSVDYALSHLHHILRIYNHRCSHPQRWNDNDNTNTILHIIQFIDHYLLHATSYLSTSSRIYHDYQSIPDDGHDNGYTNNNNDDDGCGSDDDQHEVDLRYRVDDTDQTDLLQFTECEEGIIGGDNDDNDDDESERVCGDNKRLQYEQINDDDNNNDNNSSSNNNNNGYYDRTEEIDIHRIYLHIQSAHPFPPTHHMPSSNNNNSDDNKKWQCLIDECMNTMLNTLYHHHLLFSFPLLHNDDNNNGDSSLITKLEMMNRIYNELRQIQYSFTVISKHLQSSSSSSSPLSSYSVNINPHFPVYDLIRRITNFYLEMICLESHHLPSHHHHHHHVIISQLSSTIVDLKCQIMRFTANLVAFMMRVCDRRERSFETMILMSNYLFNIGRFDHRSPDVRQLAALLSDHLLLSSSSPPSLSPSSSSLQCQSDNPLTPLLPPSPPLPLFPSCTSEMQISTEMISSPSLPFSAKPKYRVNTLSLVINSTANGYLSDTDDLFGASFDQNRPMILKNEDDECNEEDEECNKEDEECNNGDDDDDNSLSPFDAAPDDDWYNS